MPAPATTLRWLLFALFAAAVGGALLLALLSLDTALSVWQRLQGLPAGFRYVYAAVLAAAAVVIAWAGWRLLRRRPRARKPAAAPVVTRADIERRAERLLADGTAMPQVGAELTELDRRHAGGELHVALFGAINSGKSALIRALVPTAETASDVLGGTTVRVSEHRGHLPDGSGLLLADVPGSQEDAGREALAREEVLRAHWVLYLCAGDLDRSEAAEVAWLKDFDKPFALVLNQVDRYQEDERRILLSHLRARTGVEVVAISAGGEEEVEVHTADGSVQRLWRPRAPAIGALQTLLSQRLRDGAAAFEPARATAVLRGLDGRLSQVEAEVRAQRAEAVVSKYTRRAVIGAMAAVAPGSDLVIQGALGTGLVRELAALYDTPVRQIDIDALIARASRTLRTTTAVVLAIAGNAAKAFPGLGTLGGGLAHAVAYGMIFDSLGRAVADTLASGAPLDADNAAAAFAERLRQSPAPRLLGVLRSAIGETIRPQAIHEEGRR